MDFMSIAPSPPLPSFLGSVFLVSILVDGSSRMTHDFSFVPQSLVHVMLAPLLARREVLKLALGGTLGRRVSLELDVGDEEEEDSKNDAGILACGWWNHSQIERILKGRPSQA